LAVLNLLMNNTLFSSPKAANLGHICCLESRNLDPETTAQAHGYNDHTRDSDTDAGNARLMLQLPIHRQNILLGRKSQLWQKTVPAENWCQRVHVYISVLYRQLQYNFDRRSWEAKRTLTRHIEKIIRIRGRLVATYTI
jgi:hypothetical protein